LNFPDLTELALRNLRFDPRRWLGRDRKARFLALDVGQRVLWRWACQNQFDLREKAVRKVTTSVVLSLASLPWVGLRNGNTPARLGSVLLLRHLPWITKLCG